MAENNDEKLQLILQRSREHLIDFSIATNPSYVPAWHLDEIAAELEKIEKEGDKEYKVLLVFMPPRHGKSELCTVSFPVWYLGRNPTKEVITVSYSAELAQDFGSKARTIAGSDAYKAIFDISLKEDEQAKAKWKTSKGGSYTSVGVGGAVTGRGANVLIFDDPIKNREEAESETYRQKVWDFFTSTAFTRLEPNGVVVVILTRWHVDDLAGRILTNEELKKRCKIIHFPAIAIHDEEHRKVKEALWPQRFTTQALEEIKNTIGPYDFEALYQGSPVLTENQEFKPEWYKYITNEELEAKQTANFLTVDTAISKKSQADYTGFCDNSVDQENFWNLKAWRQRLNPDELVNTLFALHERRRYVSIGIEKTTFTEGLKPYLDGEQRKRGRFLPIVELKHNQTAKEVRIRGLVPRYASGSIKHLKGECPALELEQSQFPNGLHDDCVAEGSLILTDRGQVPVEQVKVGDLVMTRGGFNKVLKVWDKGEREVVTRYGLTATPEHRVITRSGEVELQYVGVSDTLYVWNEKLSCIREKSIIDIQALKIGRTESIFGHIQNGRVHQSLCIVKSMLTLTVRYLREWQCIIRTVIHSTINSLIWNFCHRLSTLLTMRPNQAVSLFQEQTLRLQGNTLRLGMVQRRDERGIGSTRSWLPTGIQGYLYVPNVLKNTALQLFGHRAFVASDVRPDMMPESFGREIPITTRKRVYDLMVENNHEFFANNILVHNCLDATAYQLQIADGSHANTISVYRPKRVGFARR